MSRGTGGSTPAARITERFTRETTRKMREGSCSLNATASLAVALCISVGAMALNPELRWIDVDRSTVTVHVSAPGGGASAIIEAMLAEGSVEDTETPHLALVIDLSALRVVGPGRAPEGRRALREQLLGPDGLEAERYSRITYHSLTIDQPEPEVWLVRGELEIHGRFRPLDVRAVRRGDRFTGSATVVPADFGVAPMPVAGFSGLVGREVRVDFDIVLEPR